MNREQEEVIQRITAQYVEEVQSGRSPQLGDYLARYPQYADEIAEFVAYFHAFEEAVPGEDAAMSALTEEYLIAMELAMDHMGWEERNMSSSEPATYQRRVAEIQGTYRLDEQEDKPVNSP